MTTAPKTLMILLDRISDFPGNPRIHDEAALDASVAALGQYRPVLARRLPDGTVQLLAGHGTRDALARAGHKSAAVTLVEADDERAARIVAADNRLSDLGGYDDRLLSELLAGLPDLDGTGYSDGDLDTLLAGLTIPERLAPGRDAEDDDEPFGDVPDKIEVTHTCPQCGYSWR